MLLDRIVLIAAWAAAIAMLMLTVPRHQIRQAHLIFMFKQALTWIIGLLVAEYHLIVYPVREFPNASGTSFSFEYFIYPATCVVFNIRYPEGRSRLHRIGWYLFFPTWMTLLEVLIEHYTHLIMYVHWHWALTWLSLLVTFFLTRSYYQWFLKKAKFEQ